MTKYNQLRERIIKHVPEIVELKFGSRIRFGLMESYVKDFSGFGHIEVVGHENLLDKNNIEIIGRDITLEDVLTVADKMALPKHFIVLPSGNIYLFESGYLGEVKANWIIGKPLQDQSPETLDFLLSVIN